MIQPGANDPEHSTTYQPCKSGTPCRIYEVTPELTSKVTPDQQTLRARTSTLQGRIPPEAGVPGHRGSDRLT